jgi:hypothetical protein
MNMTKDDLPEIIPPAAPRFVAMASAIDAANASVRGRERTARFVAIIGALYRLAIAAGVGALIWHGSSPWLLIAAVPLMFFAPKAPRS